jgi:hypothetical protein
MKHEKLEVPLASGRNVRQSSVCALGNVENPLPGRACM